MRGTSTDSVMIGLWLHHHHGRDLKESGFDGVYTYFGTDGFSYGSTTTNWMSMCKFAAAQNMLCDISVGPGYNDSLIRPWNAHNSRARGEGQYYSRMWNKALHALPQVVSITSYNEWGEGTQIEPAMSYYLDRVKEKEHRLAKQADRKAEALAHAIEHLSPCISQHSKEVRWATALRHVHVHLHLHLHLRIRIHLHLRLHARARVYPAHS